MNGKGPRAKPKGKFSAHTLLAIAKYEGHFVEFNMKVLADNMSFPVIDGT